MIDLTGAPGTNKKNGLLRGALWILCMGWALALAGCENDFETEPLVEYSTDVIVDGARPQSVVRILRPGTYLVEVRERDIDLRIGVDAANQHHDLADTFLRHGIHRMVVSLDSAAAVRITLTSVDQRSWRGAAAIRLLLWPRAAPDSLPDERLLGYGELGRAGELVARHDVISWRAAMFPLRAAAAHFLAANDVQALGEAEYLSAGVQSNLLNDFEGGRRSALSAQTHFDAAGDAVGSARAALVIAADEFSMASRLPEGMTRADRRELIDSAASRVKSAVDRFEARELSTDAMSAIDLGQRGARLRADFDSDVAVYETLRARARARGDKLFEAVAINQLALRAQRDGDSARAADLYATALPRIERDRNPVLYATLVGNFGTALTSLGQFDRALALHDDALTIFSQRNDKVNIARELASLAAIQFRSGNVGRALESVENALPLFTAAGDPEGEIGALRLAGNAQGALGRHERALEYLRAAEVRDRDPAGIDRTRVLIAGELRAIGDLRGADKLLSEALGSPLARVRADALTERARVRLCQHRAREAMADLREADGIYAKLGLDLDRIGTSSALAMALIDDGDIRAAGNAADTAMAIESRIRANSSDPQLRASFLAASYAPYEARIEVDLAGAAPRDPSAVWESFRTADSVRARSLTDRLMRAAATERSTRDATFDHLRRQMSALQADLERRFHAAPANDPETLEVRRRIDEARANLEALAIRRGGVGMSDLAIPAERASVQAMLPPDIAVLAYFVGDVRSHAWLLTRSELRHIALPNRRALENLVVAFVDRERSGEKRVSDAAFTPLLGNLLAGVTARRLIVLPDGPLNRVPFAALPLPRSQSHEVLIDRFVVTAAPSLALALRPADRPLRPDLRVAVVSDPVYTPDDRRLSVAASQTATFRGADNSGERLARLPYSAIEARAVAQAFRATDVIELDGFNATAQRVIELPSRDLGVLHFATHAIAREDAPGQSALFLSEFAPDGTPLAIDRLTAEDIASSGLRANVVVLSGCATGDGRELRGEGVLGLTYGFLANGSHNVVASLWPVEDAMTARFMEEFYAAYRAYGNASVALRAAQLRTRASMGSAVWASFVVRSSAVN